MTPDFTIQKFKEQIDTVNNHDFKLWLDVTYTYVEDYFKSYSFQARNFHLLISDVNIYLVGLPVFQDTKKEIAFKERAIGYLKSYITYIAESEKESAKMHKEIVEDIIKQRQMETTPPKSTPIPEQSKKAGIEKPNITLNLSKELFWIISSSIIVGSFFLGLYIGQVKFDKEKIEYYEQNKILNKEASANKIKIDSLTKQNLNLIHINIELDKNYKSALSNFGEYYDKYQELIRKK